jgi:hypothetical protein
MKKILCFLIVGILIFSGSGVLATSSKKSETINTESKPLDDIEVVARGGLGLTVVYKNKGNNPVDITSHNMIIIDISCPIVNINEYINGIHEIIPSKGRIKVRTFGDALIFGLGFCRITFTIHLDDDHIIDGKETINGFLLGPFVLMLSKKIV